MEDKNSKYHYQSRRAFIKNTGCAALGYTTLFSSLINVKAIASAAVDKNFGGKSDDYKALVCILLGGGADSHNMLIPRGNFEYDEYLLSRSNLAIPKSQILPLNHDPISGKVFGVHPSMPKIKGLFDSGNLSFISNVGTLIEPTSKSAYLDKSAQTPLGLFSHSDQIKHWQTGRPNDRSTIGWGGRIADLVQAQNSNPNLSMNISLSGSNFFQSGENTVEYALRPTGEVGITGYGNQDNYNIQRDAALNSLLEKQYADIYKDTYVKTFKKSVETGVEVKEALAESEIKTSFQNNLLSNQLKMVSRTIGAREQLGFQRQIFFIHYGGWDHHDEILESQQEKLPVLDSALDSFMQALNELGVANNVTTFTISDFGRTLTSNGDGSDHAWGGNAMVMGGAVNGGSIYGQYPSLELDSELMLPRGVLIPTTSTSEYFAELAGWYGVSESDIYDIFPDLINFHSPGNGFPIGFMNPNL
ncbi:MAG: DUF1501 domain-containing protein [Bacteroidota bacterium]